MGLLNFEEHMNTKVKQARKMSGLISRAISYKSKDIMVPLYKSLVRPIIEYGNAVWPPYLRKHIDFIESVQRHFTKCIIGTKNLEYEDRLKFLGMPCQVWNIGDLEVISSRLTRSVMERMTLSL